MNAPKDPGLDTLRFGSGHTVRRIEDPTLVSGRGRYTDDLTREGLAHLVMVRSPHAHARLLTVDTEPARAMPGVLAVYTGADLVAAGGTVVNIAGIAAQTPDAEFTIGGPVNSALVNFSKALAKRALADGVRVNVLCPGHIVTDRLQTRIDAHPRKNGLSADDARDSLRVHYGIQRFGETDDIAAMVAFLCSERASYVHGSTIVVDGGATPGI